MQALVFSSELTKQHIFLTATNETGRAACMWHAGEYVHQAAAAVLVADENVAAQFC